MQDDKVITLPLLLLRLLVNYNATRPTQASVRSLEVVISLIAPRLRHPSPEVLTLAQVLYSTHRVSIDLSKKGLERN